MPNDIKVFKADSSLIITPAMWAFIKHGLEMVKAKIGNRAKWTPMHVRQAILAGNSELWLGVDGEKPVGFYVLSVVNDPFIHIPVSLFIWVAYGEELHLIELGMPYIIARAKELGLQTIEFLSPRQGWGRRLENLGFDVSEVVWGLEVK
ncbi:MAG: hypothetical protein KGJ90_01900 [Patescibacteria group bacterium]|nr:hypothetical protein [Patescibacteria group bacterium]